MKHPLRVLLVTRHDYRSSWRANFQPLADGFHKCGADVSFFSTGFSFLSKVAKDRRWSLIERANKWELVNGINCYLWKTAFHPICLGSIIDQLSPPLFSLWSRTKCGDLDKAASSAHLILVESDLSCVLLRRLRDVAPKARIGYFASDLLETIGAAPAIQKALMAGLSEVDYVVTVSREMNKMFRHRKPVIYLPHGYDPEDYMNVAASPYDQRPNHVAVGSMLFDPFVIKAAAEALPGCRFHLIGTPAGFRYPSNVAEHGVMPFRETINWIRHASVGIAPYKNKPTANYIADSSMKLLQYGLLGIPAVCPDFAVGDHPFRFGYQPDNKHSIASALLAAMASPRNFQAELQTWSQVAEHIIDYTRNIPN